jgi:GNAT superfamily N-acetyltransferase
MLDRAFGGHWGSVEAWRQKYPLRPGFSPDDVHVYVVNDRIAGCMHQAFQFLTLESGLEALCSFEADLAVDPDYRRLGIMMRAHKGNADRLGERGAVVRIGYTSQDLHDRIYRQNFGHGFLPATTRLCRKTLGIGHLCASLERIGSRFVEHPLVRKALGEAPLKIDLRVHDFGPCLLTLQGETVRCVPGDSSEADLVLTLPYGVLSAWRNGRLAGLGSTLRAIVSGRLRTRGAWRLAVKLLCRLI